MLRTTLTALAIGAMGALAMPALAGDFCTVEYATDTVTYNLPSVESTFSTNDWANTSARRVEENLPSTILDAYHIRAMDSPVALYAYTGDDFNGDVGGVFCPAGYECWGSASNLSVGSLMCQREFAHKADGGGWAPIENPLIPTADMITPLAEGFQEEIESGDVDAYYDSITDIRWTTGHTYKLSERQSVTWGDRYNDMIHIHKEFHIDPDLPWIVDWATATNHVEVDIYMGPVLDDGALKFWWADTDVEVTSGSFENSVEDAIEEGLAGWDSQAALDDGIRKAVGAAVIESFGHDPDDFSDDTLVYYGDYVVSYKERLQLSHFADFGDAHDVLGFSSTSTLEPVIVLNAERSN